MRVGMSGGDRLSVQGLYDLIRDSRRRIVLPHTVLPMIAEAHRALVQLFDAAGTLTSDPRWREAADVVERARRLLEEKAGPPLERARDTFAGLESRSPIVRKGMAMVRKVAAQRQK